MRNMKRIEISPASSESEMDVDEGEEKIESDDDSSSAVEIDDNDDDDDDDDDDNNDNDLSRNKESAPISQAVDPFMDSFYGLTSTDAIERSRSAQVLVRHCLLGPDANAKDASYALKRLLNGLCSGRAASRQGMASTLSTFLKFAFRLDRMEEIRKQNENPEESELSHLAFIRNRLKSATELKGDQKSGRKKPSEERDYQFGQLFGISAVIKSGILLPVYDKHPELDDIDRVSKDYIKDLMSLYRATKWMREPATHAMATMLNSFFDAAKQSKDAQNVVKQLVNDVIVTDFLLVPNSKTKSISTILSQFSVEQLALVLCIQSNLEGPALSDLAFPFNEPLLTKDSIPVLAPILCETSSAALPRVHFVWDCIFSYLTEVDNIASLNIEIRKIRKSFHTGSESVEELVDVIVQHVIVDKLLKTDANGQNNADTKTVQDRVALALRLIRCMTGVEYMSSLAGRTKIILESQTLESIILTPTLIKRLFLDVLSSSTSGRKNPTDNSLKPESLQVLETIMRNAMDNESNVNTATTDTSEQIQKRITIAKAFVRAEPRFDAKTKTTCVTDVLGIGNKSVIDIHTLGLLENFTSFAINQVSMSDEVNSPSTIHPHEATGYIDLLFHISQSLLRTDGNRATVSMIDEKRSILDKIMQFFMLAAFFDCKSLKGDVKERKVKKKRKDSITREPLLDQAVQLKSTRSKLSSALPYSVRIVLSARFYSLWAGYITFLNHVSATSKETTILQLVSNLIDFSGQLTKLGAVKICEVSKSSDKMQDNAESEDEEEIPPSIIVEKLMKAAIAQTVGKGIIEQRVSANFATLAATLSLHLLTCGQNLDLSDNAALDVDQDDDEDTEEIRSILQDVNSVHTTLLTSSTSADENPLQPLAEICINILSSHLGRGNTSKGGSPSLIREIVKMVWVSGLTLVASLPNGSTIDTSAVNVLLNAIGASGGDGNDIDDDDNQMEDDQSESDGSDSPLSTGNKTSTKEEENDDDEEDEVELDASGFQSMLEEDSDAEIDLEHHEGADAALVRLLQAKKDARKVGQQALERVELSRQVRCLLLLETLVLGKAETWGSLIRVDTILQIILSMIKYRGKLARSLSSPNTDGFVSGQVEKRALCDRITVLVKTKLLKFKGLNNQWTENMDIDETCMQATGLLDFEIKLSSDKEQQALCNGCLMFLLSRVTDEETIYKAGQLYSNLVIDWSGKKSKMIDSSIFESMINQYPSIAPICLTQALAESVSEAKSTFLKTESCRLLVLLYNSKLYMTDSILDKLCLQSLSDSSKTIIERSCQLLNDTEMSKTKRVREVLNVLEKVLRFDRIDRSVYAAHKDDLISAINNINDSSNSTGVAQKISIVLSLLSSPGKVTTPSKNKDAKLNETATNEDNDDTDDDDHETKKSSKNTKKVSKSKKRKKGNKKR